ncbi:alpha/beta fold hydrolase [Ornithinibacillus salinisoli]|uniref:Alpha/beta fold hydrolase n=1 Tax=Ornithinibacillus salinisoli TaxID=1848459 RepID=A0ABW4W0N1_9BACI
MSNIEKGFAAVNGGNIYYEVAGEGEAILFLHGLFLDSRLWEDQFQEFAKTHKVIRLDLRGFGQTEITEEPFTNYEDLKGVLDYLNIDNVHVVGLSFGSLLGLELTIVYPNLVESLTLCSFKFTSGEESVELLQARKEFLEAYQSMDVEKCIQLQADMSLFGGSSEIEVSKQNERLYRSMLKENFQKPAINRKPIFLGNTQERLGEVQAKTLILYGEKDFQDYATGAEFLHSNINHSETDSFKHSAHMINLSEPDLFNNRLRNFIKGSVPSFH